MCMQGFACVEMMSALYSMSKDRCVEDRLCHEYRHSQGKRAVLHKRLLALHLHTKHCANDSFGSKSEGFYTFHVIAASLNEKKLQCPDFTLRK